MFKQIRRLFRRVAPVQRLALTQLPPPQGHRRPEFCGQDDVFWTTADGDILSGIVNPRKSIWSLFR